MNRFLGIDPGLQHTGWGVIQAEANFLQYISCGTIHTNSSSPMSIRLSTLHKELAVVIDLYDIHEAAVEETFVNKNAMTSLKLGQARGAIILTLSLAGIIPEEYAATLVKKSITGMGHADKNQMKTMVKLLLPSSEPDSYDAVDALAIAICHSQHRDTLTAIETKMGNIKKNDRKTKRNN